MGTAPPLQGQESDAAQELSASPLAQVAGLTLVFPKPPSLSRFFFFLHLPSRLRLVCCLLTFVLLVWAACARTDDHPPHDWIEEQSIVRSARSLFCACFQFCIDVSAVRADYHSPSGRIATPRLNPRSIRHPDETLSGQAGQPACRFAGPAAAHLDGHSGCCAG